MSEFQNVVITGASSGIGVSFSRLLASKKSNLVLTARSGDILQKLADELTSEYNITVHVFSCDLSVPGSAQKVYDYCSEINFTPDLLINNAGFGYQGKFENCELITYDAMMQLNINTLTDLTWLFGRDMLSRKKGGILNVASMAGVQPIPYFSVYAATKSYVIDLSIALWNEWKDNNVHVTALCPGPVDTKFFEVSGANPREMMIRKLQSPDSVARIGLQAVIKNKPVVPTTPALRATNWLAGKVSPVLAARMVKYFMKST